MSVKEAKFLLIEAEPDDGGASTWFAYRDEDWQDGKPMPGAPRGIGDTQEEAIAGLVIRVLNERETSISLNAEPRGIGLLRVGCDKVGMLLRRAGLRDIVLK